MVNSRDFAKRLQIILNYYGISATTFSAELDFNRSTISHLLSGRNKPSLEFIMKLLQKFPEVELYWLLEGKGNFPVEKNITSSPTEIKKEMPNLFDQLIPTLPTSKKNVEISEMGKTSEIDQIVIFYKNGHFKVYQN